VSKISGCFGEYTTVDEVCNGNRESMDIEETKPCQWRSRCRAFKRHLKETKRSKEDYLETVTEGDEEFYSAKHGLAKFGKFCDRLADKFSRKNDNVVDKRKLGPSPRAIRNAGKSLAKRAAARKSELDSWAMTFVEDFSSNLKNMKFAPAGVAVPFGKFYVIDRLDSSGYVSICYRTRKKHDYTLVRVHRKTMNMEYDADFSMDVDELAAALNKEDFKKWNPSKKVSGRIKSAIKGLSKKDLAILGEQLSRSVNRGKITIQGVESDE
jgi:hypothetical protein